MMLHSIRARLLAAAGLMILIALAAAAVSTYFIFQRHVEKRVAQELNKHYTQLVSALEVEPNGTLITRRELADPRFELPMSGLYWQVDLDGNDMARSRSLWDKRLVVPTPPTGETLEEEAHIHDLDGPNGEKLYAIEGALWLSHLGKEKLFVVTVGLMNDEIASSTFGLAREIAPALLALGLVLLIATWLQIKLGLKPMASLEKQVHDIGEGSQERLTGVFPTEVRPLVDELNQLLDNNEKRTVVARQRAGDLAHGLRTPLAVMKSLARSVEQSGLKAEADKISVQTEHMRQQVERELAQALSSSEERQRWIGMQPLINKLVNVVSMVDDNRISWTNSIPNGVQIKMFRNDSNEILGNILENAQKWAKSHAEIRLDGHRIIVGDDGPGVAPENIYQLTERGYTSRGSTGFGLSIVNQLVEKNGLKIDFQKSHLGGLEVVITFPEETVRHQVVTQI